MKLDNFILEEYDNTKEDHKRTILEISSDAEGRMYLGDLRTTVDCIKGFGDNESFNCVYIAYYNDTAVGFISISENCDYEICSGIRPKYRGEHLGALLLQEFSEKIFEKYNEVDELKLYIDNTNISSIKSAKLVGYEEIENEIYSLRRR